MPHVVLLGDSIFDNASYVAGGPDVVRQVRSLLAPGWKASLLAVDGHVTADVDHQLSRLPGDATHLVLSVGGNDALRHMDVLARPARSVGDVLDLLAEITRPFAARYRDLVARLQRRSLPVAVCTIYEGAFPDPVLQRRARTALQGFNDVILRTAFEAHVQVIDLRLVCTERGDYANPIEPSVQGGEKIAHALRRALTEEQGSRVVC